MVVGGLGRMRLGPFAAPPRRAPCSAASASSLLLLDSFCLLVYALCRRQYPVPSAVQGPSLLDQLPMETVLDSRLWMTFIEHLVSLGDGRELAYKTIENYVRGALNSLRFRFSRSESAAAFFQCLDMGASSPPHSWLKSALNCAERAIMSRDLREGVDLSESPALYACHVRAMAACEMREGSPASARNALALTLTHNCAGRGGEYALLSWVGLRWDEHFTCVLLPWLQQKTVQVKTAMLAAGKTWDSCPFFAFACAFACGGFSGQVFSVGEANFVFADAAMNPAAASSRLTNVIKKYHGRTMVVEDKSFVLPAGTTATSIRHGASEQLVAAMPAEFAIHLTGHNMRSLSALWEYLGVMIALVVPGARVLAGWSAPYPYGSLGKPPVPASLATLVSVSQGGACERGMW